MQKEAITAPWKNTFTDPLGMSSEGMSEEAQSMLGL